MQQEGVMAAEVFESIGEFSLALAVSGDVVNSVLHNVDAGHRAVIFDQFRGVQDIVVGEGPHFLIPWVQKPAIFDCCSQPRNVPLITGSKDLQNVNIALRIPFPPASCFLSTSAWARTTMIGCCHPSPQRPSSQICGEKAEQQKAAIISAEGDSKTAELIANLLATAGDGLIELQKL